MWSVVLVKKQFLQKSMDDKEIFFHVVSMNEELNGKNWKFNFNASLHDVSISRSMRLVIAKPYFNRDWKSTGMESKKASTLTGPKQPGTTWRNRCTLDWLPGCSSLGFLRPFQLPSKARLRCLSFKPPMGMLIDFRKKHHRINKCLLVELHVVNFHISFWSLQNFLHRKPTKYACPLLY